jgi:hypothetical protein
MLRNKRVIALGLVGMLGVISSGEIASAHFVKSNLSLHADDKRVSGNEKVILFGKLSPRGHKAPCRRTATIELVRRNTGVVATTGVDREGEFFFRIDPKPNHGTYFARYGGSGKFGYQNRHRCGARSSNSIEIKRERS